jgi:hypothetical protein
MQTLTVEDLRAAAAVSPATFKPRLYRVRVSPRRWRRHRLPGWASRVSPLEARAIQGLRWQGWPVTDLAGAFRRTRGTIRRVLHDPAFVLFVNAHGGVRIVRTPRVLSAETRGKIARGVRKAKARARRARVTRQPLSRVARGFVGGRRILAYAV